jgi:membrane-anchored protein YejM (alkaline phosphatase superfamily)
MRERALYFVRTYLVTVIIFVMAKVVFMVANFEGHPFGIGDVWEVIVHGLSLDLSTSIYIIFIPFLVSMVTLWWKPRGIGLLMKIYYAIIALTMTLAFTADTSLYPFWGFKLDASCLQYLESPAEAKASVSGWYMAIRLGIIVGVSYLIYLCYKRVWRSAKCGVRNEECRSTMAIRVRRTVFYLICIPLMVIGVRGGLDESTTNIGQVYYSENQFLNHSAVNPVFSFFASLEKTASNHITYHFMDDETCQRLIARWYDTRSVGCDTLLTTQQPNIIIILLEGCGGEFTEIGGRTDITPNLNRLAHEGVYFTNCYGNTWRTDRGTVCTWSGYPSFPTMSVMKMPSKTRRLPNIAKTLREERGYETSYLYGGDINFTNMRSYLISGGFQTLVWKKDYSREEQNSGKWGVRDDITCHTLFDMAQKAQEPFLIGYSTLSSHEPWDVPLHKFEDEKVNAFAYLDECIGKFVEALRKTPLWDRTLVVLLPDHGITYNGLDETTPLKNHIPMIWVGGALKGPKRIEKVCNQTDLPATLLGQLGMKHEAFRFSRDVLSETYQEAFALNTYDDGFSVYDSIGFVNYDFIGQRIVKSEGNREEEQMLKAKAVLQAASEELSLSTQNLASSQ